MGRNTQRSSPWAGGIRRKPLKVRGYAEPRASSSASQKISMDMCYNPAYDMVREGPSEHKI